MSYGVDVANIYEILSGGEAKKKAAPSTRGDESEKVTDRKVGPAGRGGRGGRGRGRGGGRGGERNRGDRAPKNRTEGHATRKRQYDRKSGTGRSGVENKKGGGGKGNWGKVDDFGAESAEVQPKEGAVAEQENGEPGEPEVETLTLEEFRKLQAQKKVELETPAPRKPNEGSDGKQWEKFQKLNRDEEDDTGFLNVNNTKKSGTKKSKNSKETVAVDQVFRVRSEKAQRGGRGGKRGGRGGGERNDPPRNNTGGNRKNVKIDTSDEAMFPALGK